VRGSDHSQGLGLHAVPGAMICQGKMAINVLSGIAALLCSVNLMIDRRFFSMHEKGGMRSAFSSI
jgi:hypothetical protein